MARTDRTIEFRAVDNNISNVLEAFRQKVANLSKDMIKDSVAVSSNSKQIIKDYEEQIRLLEKKRDIQIRSAQVKIERQYFADVESAAGDKGKLKTAVSDRAEAMREAQQDKRETDLQVQLLRELISTIKATAKDEIQENRKGVEKRIKDYEKGKLKDLSDEDRTKLEYQKTLLSEDKEIEQSGFMRRMLEMTGAVAVGNLISKIPGKLINTANVVGQELASSKGADYTEARLAGMIPIVGQFLQAGMERHIEERQQAMIPINRLYAMTGRLTAPSATQYGYDYKETAPIAMELARTRMRGGADLTKSTIDVIAMQKGLGIDQGTIMNIAKRSYMDTNQRGLIGGVTDVISIMQSKGMMKDNDFSKLSTLLTIQNQLTEEQSTILEKVNTGVNANIVATFQKIGGSFAGVDAGARISSINRALTSPSNEFQQAQQFAILSQLKPKASFWELQRMQERGIIEPQLLSKTMEENFKRYGGVGKDDEWFKQSIKTRFGLSFAQTDTLVDAWKKDKTVFDKISSEEELKSFLSKDKAEAMVYGRAADKTTKIEMQQAEFSNAFAVSFKQGISKVGLEVGKQIADDIKAAVKDSNPFIKVPATGAANFVEKLSESFPYDYQKTVFSN